MTFDVTSTAHEQLDRILAFFPRVESKISTLFAVNAGMLGFLAVNVRIGDIFIWYLAIPYLISVILIGTSVWFLYRASYPILTGGESSLIYFFEIAKRTESNYVAEAEAITEEAWRCDLFGQIWRNSQILSARFLNIKYAFISTALALTPWFIAVLLASEHHDKFLK